ncbi:MAG: putative rane protein [Gemmatimonadetes bacterium]|nr:putative rane protein [Gemmatimonadota bacterium]
MTTPTPTISAAEQSTSARVGAVLFRHRGWLPVPFLLVPLLVPAQQTMQGWLVALVLILVGEAVRMAGVAAAGTVTRRRSRNVQRLVTYGIFSRVRNPLYVGNFLIWIGFGVGSGVLWFIPIAVLLFAVEYTFIVRYEEGVLESIFGQEYLDYKARTNRWIPGSRRADAVADGEHHWAEAWKSEVSTFLQYVAIGVVFWAKARWYSR